EHALMSRITRRFFLKTAATAAATAATVPLIQGCTGVQPPQPQAATAPATTAPEAKPTAAAGAGAQQWLPADYKARSEEWKSLPADHKKGTLIKQEDWYKILGN